MKPIILKFVGGPWDGKTLRSDSTDQEEVWLAAACYETSHHGTIGADCVALSDRTTSGRRGRIRIPWGEGKGHHLAHDRPSPDQQDQQSAEVVRRRPDGGFAAKGDRHRQARIRSPLKKARTWSGLAPAFLVSEPVDWRRSDAGPCVRFPGPGGAHPGHSRLHARTSRPRRLPHPARNSLGGTDAPAMFGGLRLAAPLSGSFPARVVAGGLAIEYLEPAQIDASFTTL